MISELRRRKCYLCTSSCRVRPSGSESLPGSDNPSTEAFEDVSTCGVSDFPVMDSIPEHAPVTSKKIFLLLVPISQVNVAFSSIFFLFLFCSNC